MPSLNHNIKRTHSFENLHMEGKIPEDLKGTLYRVGPGLVERFGQSKHPFMADGAITAVRINESAQGACKLVESEAFLEEERAGKTLYDPDAPLLRRLYNGVTRSIKNTGNTQVLHWQGELYALMEQGKPVRFSESDLATLGTDNLGIIEGSFSAHPHRVEQLKTTFNFGINGNMIEVFALPDNGNIKILTRFKAPWIALIHDFIVTKKHVLFFIDPAKVIIWRAMLGLKDFSKYFQWDQTEGTHIIVIPLNDPESRTQITVDPFRVWHFANAYEQVDEIIIDAFRHKNIDVLTKPTQLDDDIPKPELYRFTVNTKKKAFTDEALSDVIAEFPIVNPNFIGKQHRYIWMQHYQDTNGNEGIAVHDTHTDKSKRWSAPDDHLCSEAIFVPKPNNNKEDNGWLLQLIQDSNKQKSYLAVFNSITFEDGPVAKLWFDHPIPATFHGIFVPEVAYY